MTRSPRVSGTASLGRPRRLSWTWRTCRRCTDPTTARTTWATGTGSVWAGASAKTKSSTRATRSRRSAETRAPISPGARASAPWPPRSARARARARVRNSRDARGDAPGARGRAPSHVAANGRQGGENEKKSASEYAAAPSRIKLPLISGNGAVVARRDPSLVPGYAPAAPLPGGRAAGLAGARPPPFGVPLAGAGAKADEENENGERERQDGRPRRCPGTKSDVSG